jgi:hypothetical protein
MEQFSGREKIERIEIVVERAGPKGISLKTIKRLTGFKLNTIKWVIYNSNNIDDCDPIVHGSLKTKIRVLLYKPHDTAYIKRKQVDKKHLKKEVKLAVN